MARHGWHAVAVLTGLGVAVLFLAGAGAAFTLITKVIEFRNTECAR
jgi:hypothetical protein